MFHVILTFSKNISLLYYSSFAFQFWDHPVILISSCYTLLLSVSDELNSAATSGPVSEAQKENVCTYCGQDFVFYSELQTHLTSHSGKRPYTCDVCKMAFARGAALTKHKRIHTEEKPHRCTICGTAFITRNSLTSHMGKQHGKFTLGYRRPNVSVPTIAVAPKLLKIKTELG